MKTSFSSMLFGLLLICAAIFVTLTSGGLPAVVASHFGASGEANGFMSRSTYLIFMLVFALGLPAAMIFVTSKTLHRPDVKMNLPNREYWLRPERRLQTIGFIQAHLARFACMLVVLMCFVHWCVLRANALQPAHLNLVPLLAGLSVFFVATLVWMAVLYLRFRRIR